MSARFGDVDHMDSREPQSSDVSFISLDIYPFSLNPKIKGGYSDGKLFTKLI